MEENIKEIGRMENNTVRVNFFKIPLLNGGKDNGVKERELDGLMIKIMGKIFNKRFLIKI
jgi:hypothetical protein